MIEESDATRRAVRSRPVEQSSNIDVPSWTVYNLRAIGRYSFLDARDSTGPDATGRDETVTGRDGTGRDERTHTHVYAYLHARVCRGASDQRTSARESQACRDLCASGSTLRSFIQDESHVPEAPDPTTTPLLYPLRFTFRISATDRVRAFPFFCLVSRSVFSSSEFQATFSSATRSSRFL